MCIATSPDIFQDCMNELFEGFEFVHMYIDDLLVITKGTYMDHLEKLNQVLNKLHEANLQVNIQIFFSQNKTMNI